MPVGAGFAVRGEPGRGGTDGPGSAAVMSGGVSSSSVLVSKRKDTVGKAAAGATAC